VIVIRFPLKGMMNQASNLRDYHVLAVGHSDHRD